MLHNRRVLIACQAYVNKQKFPERNYLDSGSFSLFYKW